MTVKPLIPVADAASLVNSLASQHFGGAVVADDLSDIADLGKSYDQLDSGTKQIVTSQMITLVTEQLFKIKQYKGLGPDLVRSRGDYDPSGGLIQVNRPSLPEAIPDVEVYDPVPGSSSDPFVNHAVEFETTYYSKPFAFRYEVSHPERWFTGMLASRDALFNVIRAIDTAVDNAFALNVEGISMSLIRASMISNLNGVTLADGGPRAVNLLAEFNTARGLALTVDSAINDPEFMRWSINRIVTVYDDMQSYSGSFNDQNYPTFSRADDLRMVMLSSFKHGIEQFLLSDTYNEQYLQLPTFEKVTAWKSFLGSEATFASKSRINDTVTLPGVETPVTLDTTGVIAHVFDSDRINIQNLGAKVTTQYDPVGLKTNQFTHVAGRTLVDTYANGVTFYLK